MNGRININVSATDYDKTNKEITNTLANLEEMVHETDGFVVTDSEFAFGWHFYVVSVRQDLCILSAKTSLLDSECFSS